MYNYCIAFSAQRCLYLAVIFIELVIVPSAGNCTETVSIPQMHATKQSI